MKPCALCTANTPERVGGDMEPIIRKGCALRRHSRAKGCALRRRGPCRSVCRAREAMHRALWWPVWGGVGLLSVVLWGETGCISVMSARVHQQADQTLTFAQLHARPEAYIGRTVILGGEIVR